MRHAVNGTCRLPSLSFPYTKALLSPNLLGRGQRGLPEFHSSLSDHVAARTPEMPCAALPLLLAHSADFAYKIEARPSHYSLRGYLCVHFCCNLSFCRSIFLYKYAAWRHRRSRAAPDSCQRESGYVVESLSIKPFPAIYRLLTTQPQRLNVLNVSSEQKQDSVPWHSLEQQKLLGLCECAGL